MAPLRRIRITPRSAPAEGGSLPTHPFERRVLRGYVAAAAREMLPRARRYGANDEFVEWLREHEGLLGVALPFEADDEDEEGAGVRLDRRRLRTFADAVLERRTGLNAKASALQKRLLWIGETLTLEPFDTELLGAAVRNVLYEPLHGFVTAVSDNGPGSDEVDFATLALLVGDSAKSVRARLSRSQPLVQLGLLEDRHSGDFAPSRTVMRLVRETTTDPDRLRATLFGAAKPSELEWEDFEHIARQRDLAANLVQAALDRRETGFNVLLYGEPGTGKTEFAKVLAEKVGARAVFVGEADEEGDEPSRFDRIAHLTMASTLAARAGRTVLVVDEADDVFTGVDEDARALRVGSKVFTNRVVERSAAPTVWITNASGRLGTAVLRRMGLAVHFPQPDSRQRRRMAERSARRHAVALDATGLDRLAETEGAPALMDAGLRAAALLPDASAVETAERTVRSLARATGTDRAVPKAAQPFGFDPSLAHADLDLEKLADRAVAAPSRALSFLLSGGPGTGKSAWAAFLAERMGLELMERRASDLMSMWVGGTEANIATAFAQARDEEKMLLIDEADSMLRARAGADRSWEVTQVNEMLTWMERHPLPFVMTTNALDALDSAAMRRFVFKVTFKPMRRAQIAAAFSRAFGADAPPEALALADVTPGDIAVVARKAAVLGETDPQVLARWLAAECAAKPGGSRGRLGFAPPGAPHTAQREPDA